MSLLSTASSVVFCCFFFLGAVSSRRRRLVGFAFPGEAGDKGVDCRKLGDCCEIMYGSLAILSLYFELRGCVAAALSWLALGVLIIG